MVISLTPRLNKQLDEIMAQGRYANAEEAVEKAFDLLDEQIRFERLRAIVAEADAEIARGEVDELTPELLARIDDEADELHRKGIEPAPYVWP